MTISHLKTEVEQTAEKSLYEADVPQIPVNRPYNDKQSPEDGSRVNSRNVMCIKYTSDRGYQLVLAFMVISQQQSPGTSEHHGSGK
jgi:hypothetical protein